jgi:thiosulfate/3-mercaptopyruvate sulfurtransferase
VCLISAEALLARLDDPALRVADVRWWLSDPAKGRRDYATGHVPGAVFVDLDTDLVAPEGPGRHPLPHPGAFLRRMEALGFDDASDIVAYDDAGGTIAARLWWMLDDLGHPRVRVLDGGIQAWVAAGGSLTAVVPTPPPGGLRLRERWTRTIDREALTARLGEVRLLDARAGERYRGEVEPIDPVAGHIPTAVSRPSALSLAPDGRFLPAAELRVGLLAGAADTVTSCGSGVTACHTALAMRIAGLPDPLLYPGSYSDWSRAGMPVATGDEPGEVPGGIRRPV